MEQRRLPVWTLIRYSLVLLAIIALLIFALSRATTEYNKDKSNKVEVSGGKKMSIRMPDIRPDHGEQYLCMARRVETPSSLNEYIVGFKPQSDANRVHHMLLYGCQAPGLYQRDSPEFVWDCSSTHSVMGVPSGAHEHSGTSQENSFERAPVCQGEMQILYGWAKDAPAFELPQGVGFKIGSQDTGIEFLVLQVHFGDFGPFQRSPELTDNSGLVLDLGDSEQVTRRAGVLLMSSIGHVAMGRSKHEIWCEIDEDIELHPFSYRVHTHKLGVRVLGARIAPDELNVRGLRESRAQIIGVGDPQKPQMFWPVRENLTITKGDNVYASCEYFNNQLRVVQIGQTGEDEMCNFYLMYWTDGERLLRNSNCVGPNPVEPFMDWQRTLLD